MEPYMQISFLNDFIFCPRSIYFHQLYGRVKTRLYQKKSQIAGTAAHKTVDAKKYSSKKSILQTISIYSDKYKLGGKIDTYDIETKTLVERKKKIKVIYDGYVYQLYAQYHCLVEMGYEVEQLKLYSMDDNKSYPVKSPKDDIETQSNFEKLIKQMHDYDLNEPFEANPNKCKYCIYNNLCDKSLC